MGENFAGVMDLMAWFERVKRPFPWRGGFVSPYAVWISEVMLQQTRAEVVVPYFLEWMQRFPTINALAAAREEEVVKTWEGLGYYARARRLLQAARYLQECHGGELPACPESLSKIPGFGPYTVGAVMSFAFHKKAAAVDGNVLRFLSRYLLLRKDISKSAVQEEFRKHALELLPEEKPWIAMEAMIELGATVCKKTPICSLCPVAMSCRAFAGGVAAELPLKSAGPSTIRLCREAAVVKCGDEVLVKQVAAGKVMAGLYEFPMFDEPIGDIEKELKNIFGKTLFRSASFDAIRYSFTRYSVTLRSSLWEVDSKVDGEGYKHMGQWIELKEIRRLPFSSGHRRLCEKILQFLFTC